MMREQNADSFCLRDWLNWEINASQGLGGCGRDGHYVEMNSSCDPIDLLPGDPFEMNLGTTLLEIDLGKRISAALAGWIGYSSDDYEVGVDDLAVGSNYYWGNPFLSSFETQVNYESSAVDFCNVGFSGSVLDVTRDESFGAMDEVLISGRAFSGSVLNVTGDGSFGPFGAMEEVLVPGSSFLGSVLNVTRNESFGNLEEIVVSDRAFSGSIFDFTGDGSFWAFSPMEKLLVDGRGDAIYPDEDVNCLHEGLLLSLGYLGVQDLLSIEQVCRSLRAAVQSDPLLWRCIHIDSQLGEKITDDALYQLTQRAQGSLQCLSLVQCSKITDDGLKRVLDSNLMLKKLNVTGCLRLTTEGLINNLKTLKLSGMPGIKNLKLGRHFIGSAEDFEELELLVGANEPHQIKTRKLQFFHDEVSSLVCDDDIAIDIEICPGCNKSRLLFDCPSESCRSKGPDHCRACGACIERCIDCGSCVENCKYMETFFLNNVCSGCANHSSESEDLQDGK